MHSKLFYNYCVWNDEESALWSLKNFGDVDILYDKEGIINSICTNNNAILLQASLDYFENIQFPDKGEQYKEAHGQLVDILEEVINWIDSSSPVYPIIYRYMYHDIANLNEVAEIALPILSGQDHLQHLKEDATTEERDSSESRKDSDDMAIKLLPFTMENLEILGHPYWCLNTQAEEHYKKGEKSEAICKIQKSIQLVADNSNTTAHIEHKAMVIYNYLRFTDGSWDNIVNNVKHHDRLLHYMTEVLSIAQDMSDDRVTHDIFDLCAHKDYIMKEDENTANQELCSQIECFTLSSKHDMPYDNTLMQQKVVLTGDAITSDAQEV